MPEQCYHFLVAFMGFTHPYCDATTVQLTIVLLWSHHTILAWVRCYMPQIPVDCCVRADEVLKRYTPDKYQGIHRMISCETLCPMKYELGYLTIHLPR
jgi:hypothetical protein